MRYIEGVTKNPAESGERVIKRYDNRKLYDPRTKTYVTLEELARLISEGQDVKVVDQKTGEDLTTTVLAQVILEAVKQRTANIPRQVLVRLIRLGMSPTAERPRRARGKDATAQARQEAEKIVGGLLRRGGLPLEDALRLRQEIASALHRLVGETQRGLEQRFHSLVEWTERESGVNPAIQSLKERLLTLESYLGDKPPAAPRRAASRSRRARRPRN